MLRTLRRLLLLAIAAVIAAGVVVALTTRPKLDKDQRAIDSSWTPLRRSLDVRYTQARVLADAMCAAHSACDDLHEAPITALRDTARALDAWKASSGADTDVQVRAANTMEGVARRLVGIAGAASLRYHARPEVVQAANGYRATTPAAALVDAMTARVRTYQDDRSGPFTSVIAGVMRADEMPLFVVATT